MTQHPHSSPPTLTCFVVIVIGAIAAVGLYQIGVACWEALSR